MREARAPIRDNSTACTGVRPAATNGVRALAGAVALAACVWAPAPAAASRVEALALFAGGAMVEVDGVRRTLRVGGAASPEGCRLLSASSRAGVVECAGVRHELVLSARVGGQYGAVERASMRLTADRAGQYWARGTIDGQPVDLLVDTGASVVAMSARTADRLGIRIADDAASGFVVTAQGRARARMAMVARIEVGAIAVHNVEVAVLDGDYPQQILLGMSFLRHVDIAHQGGVLLLSER
jgi:aspartyl protease family protein